MGFLCSSIQGFLCGVKIKKINCLKSTCTSLIWTLPRPLFHENIHVGSGKRGCSRAQLKKPMFFQEWFMFWLYFHCERWRGEVYQGDLTNTASRWSLNSYVRLVVSEPLEIKAPGFFFLQEDSSLSVVCPTSSWEVFKHSPPVQQVGFRGDPQSAHCEIWRWLCPLDDSILFSLAWEIITGLKT